MMSCPSTRPPATWRARSTSCSGHDAVTRATVGAVGFCMGGGFVLLLAAQQGDRVSAAVPFYGVGPAVPQTYAGLTAAVQGHYGERDDFYPADDARGAGGSRSAQESGAEVEFFFYDAGARVPQRHQHARHLRPEDAALAWDRTVAFLRDQGRLSDPRPLRTREGR